MILRLFWLLATVLLATRRSNPMPTDTDTLPESAELGDVVNSTENPVLQPEADAVDTIDVLINTTHARRPNGHHPIRVYIPENATLTAAQAHQLHIDLETASRVVADIRRDAGYGS